MSSNGYQQHYGLAHQHSTGEYIATSINHGERDASKNDILRPPSQPPHSLKSAVGGDDYSGVHSNKNGMTEFFLQPPPKKTKSGSSYRKKFKAFARKCMTVFRNTRSYKLL